MKSIRRMLIIGVLATVSIIGCGNSDKGTSSSAANSETTAKETKVEETTNSKAKKEKF